MSSHYWRSDLKRRAEKLRNKEAQVKWGEDSLCILEQVVVLGFYSIRRLELSGLCPPEKLKAKYNLVEYPKQSGSDVPRAEKEEAYDFDQSQTIKKDLAFIEHQLSHSCFFESQFDKNNHPESCFFTSDHQKNKALYQIKLQDVIEIFESLSQLDIM